MSDFRSAVQAFQVQERSETPEISEPLHAPSERRTASGKRILSSLAACDEAARLLKLAGFEFVAAARTSTSTYYRMPGRPGVIRVSDHGSKGGMPGLDLILARITFPPFGALPDHLVISPDKLKTMVAEGIGRFFLNQRAKSLPNYHVNNEERTQ